MLVGHLWTVIHAGEFATFLWLVIGNHAIPTNRTSEINKFQTRGCKSTMLIHEFTRHRGFSVSPQHYDKLLI